MDPPYIHQSRYVPISPPPSNPNLYRSEIYLPPQPQPQQLLPPAAAAAHQLHHHHLSPPHTSPSPVHNVSFNSHHSQFQFSPKFSPSPNPNPQNQYHHQRSNKFFHRISINDDLQQQQHQQNDHHHHHRRLRLAADLDARSDVWDRPPRSLPDDRPVVSNLDHLQFDHQPMSPYRPTDKLKHEFDSSYRFRERYSNDDVQFEYRSSNNSNQRVEFVPHLSHFVSDSDRLNSSSYDNRRRGSQFDNNELMRNNVRDVVLDRQVLSDRESCDSVFGGGSNIENGGDGVRVFSGKRESYGSDSVRYGNNRGSRGNSYYQYYKTPRKQVQRKSALLRIQKPYYRNRDDGELHNSTYEMKYGSVRGKDQVVFSDCEVGEDKQKEGSHVELDVSFKSNSLVAKASLAPSSSTIVSDANLTPKKGNTRKIMMSDKDHSSSSTKKPLDNRRKLDGSRDAVSNVSGSGNTDSKQTVKKVAPSGANRCDNNSQPCSRGSNNLPAKITVEKWGTDVGTTKTSSLKVAKKKVVKKVLKKAINAMAHAPSFQPTEKLDEHVKANCSTLDATAAPVLKMGVKPSKDKITYAAMTSCHLGDLQPYTNEANMLTGNDQVGGSPHVAMVSKEVSTDSDSCLPCFTKFKRKRSGLLSPLVSSCLKEAKTDEGSVNADNCLRVLHTTSNTDNDPTKLLNKTNFSDGGSVEAANNQFCHNGHSLLLENSETKELQEALLSEGRNINSDLLSLEENIWHEGPVNTSSLSHVMNTTTSSSNGRCEISALSSSVETGIHNVSIHADCSNRDKSSVSGSDNVNTNSEEINPGNDDYNDRQLATNEATISLENGAAEGFPNTQFSVGNSEEDMSNNTDNSKVMTSLSDLPMISDVYMGPVEAVSSAQSVHTTLSLSVKDCCPAEVRITECLDTGIQSCSDGLSVFRGCNLTGGCCEANVSDSSVLNGASPTNKKRRKVSASHTGFTGAIESEIAEGLVTPDPSTSGVELRSNSIEGLIQPEEGVAVSNLDALCDSSLPPCPDGISTTKSNDELVEFDSLSNMGSPEILSTASVLSTLNLETSISQNSNERVCRIDKKPNEKHVDEGTSNLSAHTSSTEHANINLKLDYLLGNTHSVASRTVLLPAQDVKGAGHNLNPLSGETSRIHSRSLSSGFIASRNVASSTRTTKARTWHRTENSSASPAPGNKSFLGTVHPPNQLPKKVAKFQNMSYVRKGNSLVRKPVPVAALPQASHCFTPSVYQLNSLGICESKKTNGSDSGADVIDPPNLLRMGGVNAPLERPRAPPSLVAEVPNRATTNSAGDRRTSLVTEPLPNCCSLMTSDPQKLMAINDEPNSSNDALKISETPVKKTASVNSLESQDEFNDGSSSTSNVKKITYLKRKSNQLIAASNDCGFSVHSSDKTQSTISDGCYKRRKNQLIRTSMESHINQTVSLADDSFTSKGEKCPKDIFRRSSNKSQSYKAVKKIHKPLRFSMVWTQNSMQSSKNDDNSLYRQMVLPYLFPWKRAVNWRRFAQDSVSTSKNSFLSAISRKLLLLRKRDTVYTRSNHGFSLRKSKVLSVGGSGLKWSKSMENHSKKANEEATLAVAAVEKKRQQNGAELFASETKRRSRSCRERIFRIGSVRYKMDSSRRTLQRILDDESSCVAAPNLDKNVKKSYIPRRLVIGSEEYVRIGNGNRLIRDPKKRARVLASEKVRWSLHTARLRLARKQKYCQFFTRFGKCNKDDGKCPYIHDPSKIAVCTKFLNGLCSNSDCKLTHKVIPDRMPDCSYFLQGLCTNKNCPYRHVHVNPNAPTCEGFLKGYCADGNECRKKHRYVCPTFEATGYCPLGSKCKLHHPKSISKGKKSRRSRKQKKTYGRYFGSMLVEDSDPQITKPERSSIQDSGNLFIEGKLADYIKLDVSDEAGEADAREPMTLSSSDASDSQSDDLDEIIKPIHIMNISVNPFSPGRA